MLKQNKNGVVTLNGHVITTDSLNAWANKQLKTMSKATRCEDGGEMAELFGVNLYIWVEPNGKDIRDILYEQTDDSIAMALNILEQEFKK